MSRQITPADVLPLAVAATTAVPLDSNKTLPRRFVSAPITFTVGASPANGGQCVLPLVADGASAVTFSGFTEAGTSAGYRNVNGILNLIQFFYLDGTPYFSVSQAVGAQPILQAATTYTLTGPSTATVGSASSNFTVQSNGTLSSAVTVTPSDGGGGGSFSPATVTLAANASGTSSATFTYTPASAGTKTISTTNNGGLTNPASISLTASAAATGPIYVRMPTTNGLTETVSSPGYTYTANANDTGFGTGYGVTAVAIPSGADGFFGATLKTPATQALINGMSVQSTNNKWDQNDTYAIYCDTSNSNTVWRLIRGSTGNIAPTTSVAFAAGDVARVRRSGTSIIAEVSKDNGSTWTAIYTWTGVPTGALYGHFQTCNTTTACINPFGSSNVA